MLLDSSEQELLLEAYFILLSLSRENVRVKCSAKRSVVPSEADNIQGRASQGWRGTRVFNFLSDVQELLRALNEHTLTGRRCTQKTQGFQQTGSLSKG